ncbi:type VII secretion integral membrane protein EccD [Catenuloplanes nepalensis]|uniref:Type VII secretion integral membrane protein EccD n=1 Tax=Catenuloplanes nepalensis TaxID=587533 RepID=A0ABT9N1L4_9ACTN|nr:type VII secretion integral membrane protein EccD [Catenuloplanes nepalensis]MDP9797587.1 type VII secretion integral membrane protein EccD [Catenuloplanes nepalensis]
MAATASGSSRVTIVAPRTRLDLALPSDVPLADLLPTVLRHAGEDVADQGAAQGGWALARLGGKPLDSSRTAVELEIRDGEMLYFTPRAAARPEVVFDDIVDAVATATQNREGRWDTAMTRRFSVGFAAVALLAGAVGVLFSGPPHLPGGAAALAVAALLMLTATMLSRAAGDGRSGAMVAGVSLVFGIVGGTLLLAGDTPLTALGAPHALLGAAVLLILGVVATLAVGYATPLFLGSAAAGVALALGAGICVLFGLSAAPAAAIVAAAVFAFHPALPMMSYRLARVPVPSIPTGPDDLKADEESVDGRRVLQLSERADEYLTALIWTVSAIVFGAEITLAFDGRLGAVLLCLVLALLLLLRARPYPSRRERLPSLLAGGAGLILTAFAIFGWGGWAARLGLVLGGLILVAAISLIYGLSVAGKRIAPIWGRLLDIAEILLILAVVPLAAWVCGLYSWITTITA